MQEKDRLIDSYGRTIEYLRISLTDKCNLRCAYCMPKEGVTPLSHSEILTLEETYRLVELFCGMGIRKIRFTGGEPLVRKNFMSLIRRISELSEVPEMSITTNGVLLQDYLPELRDCGVKNINISIDSLKQDLYQRLTGVDAVDRVKHSIEQATEMGFNVKLNSVIVRGVNEGEVEDLVSFAKDRNLDIRFIELMPMGCAKDMEGISGDEILGRLEAIYGKASPATWLNKRDIPKVKEQTEGPAVYYTFPGSTGKVGFINPMTHAFCSECNRIRLTVEGFMKLCLYYQDGLDLKEPLRSGCTDEELEEKIREAILRKPKKHEFQKNMDASEKRKMFQIGG